MEPTEFDLKIYREYNDDLKEMSDEELETHNRIYGSLENRIKSQADVDRILAGFDISGYRKLNLDLAALEDEELKRHWVKHGRKEGRVFYVDKDYSISDTGLEYVRKVDYRKVVKHIEEVVERVCNYQGKLPLTNVADLKKDKVATFIIDSINKTDKALPKDTKRYIFAHVFPIFVEFLYNSGVLFHADFLKWREIAIRDVGLFDEIVKA